MQLIANYSLGINACVLVSTIQQGKQALRTWIIQTNVSFKKKYDVNFFIVTFFCSCESGIYTISALFIMIPMERFLNKCVVITVFLVFQRSKFDCFEVKIKEKSKKEK